MATKTVMQVYRDTLRRAQEIREFAQKQKPVDREEREQKQIDLEVARELYAVCAALEATEEVNPSSNDREMNDAEREEIARLIVDGCTSGILDADGYRCAWELKANIFEN